VAVVLDDRAACSGLLDDAEAVELVDDGFVLVFMASRHKEAGRVGANGFVLLRRHMDPVQAVWRPALTDESERGYIAHVAHDRLIASPEDDLVLGATLLTSRHGSHIPLALNVNERINDDSMRFQPSDVDEPRYWQFVCECASTACVDHIELTKEEYEEVRDDPTHFAVLPGHEEPGIETVARRTERFVVVEKQVARDQLAASEPRS